jgi:alpha-glucosidase (family GH31 glycosyl hydrolase)
LLYFDIIIYYNRRKEAAAMDFAKVRDVLGEGDKLTFFISLSQTDGTAPIALEITSPCPDILGVKEHKNKPSLQQVFGMQPLGLEETPSAYIVRSGKMAAVLSKGRFSLSFTYDGKPLARAAFKESTAYLDLEVDELIYGRAGGFSLSSKGYGIYIPGGEELSYYIIGGGSIKAAAANYRVLTGKPYLPPDWSFGLWLSASLCSEFDEGKANRLAKNLDGIALSKVSYSRFWDIEEPPVHWIERCEDSFAGMAETLRSGLSLSMSGTVFWGHDIGGIDAGVYRRWVAFGLFSTHTRLNVGRSSGTPWQDDMETADVLRNFAKIKSSLMPYIFAESVKAAQSGIPVMRHMIMEYPDDPFCLMLERQYMLGGSMLAAPVFFEDGHCDVYLPDGMFTNFFTGEVVAGGRLIRGKYNYMTLPVFIPENTLLPTAREEGCDYHENITVRAYQLTEQSVELYDKNGTLRATVTGRAHGDDVTFQVDGEAPGLMFEV